MKERAISWEADMEPNTPQSNQWMILFSVGLGLFMVVIDITILNIAMPTLAGSMNASLEEIEWALIAYTVVLTGLVPFFGRVSDLVGRKRLFLSGLLIFALASLLAALSPSILWLIAARLLQAVGGAQITSNILAIITDIFLQENEEWPWVFSPLLLAVARRLGPPSVAFWSPTLGGRRSSS